MLFAPDIISEYNRWKTCKTCKGSGFIHEDGRAITEVSKHFSGYKGCPACDGRGTIERKTEKCPYCDGVGVREK
jgi:DnaJ-class molecular chaperone